MHDFRNSHEHLPRSATESNKYKKPTGGRKRRLCREYRDLKASLISTIENGCTIDELNCLVRKLSAEQRTELIKRMDQGVDGKPMHFTTLLRMRAPILCRSDTSAGQNCMSPREIWNDTLLNAALRSNGSLALTSAQQVADRVVRLHESFDGALAAAGSSATQHLQEGAQSLMSLLSLRNFEANGNGHYSLTHENMGAFAQNELASLKSILIQGRHLEVFMQAARSLTPTGRDLLLRAVTYPSRALFASFTDFLPYFIDHVRRQTRRSGGNMPNTFELWCEGLTTWAIINSPNLTITPAEQRADCIIRGVGDHAHQTGHTHETGHIGETELPFALSLLPGLTRLTHVLRPHHLGRGQIDPVYNRLERPIDTCLSSPSRTIYQHLINRGSIEEMVSKLLSIAPEVRSAISLRKHFAGAADNYGIYDQLKGCVLRHLFIRKESVAVHYSPEDVWIQSIIASALRTVQASGAFRLTADQSFVDGVIRLRLTAEEAWKSVPLAQRQLPQTLNSIGKYLYLRFEKGKPAGEAISFSFEPGTVRTPIELFVLALAESKPALKNIRSQAERNFSYNQYFANAMRALIQNERS